MGFQSYLNRPSTVCFQHGPDGYPVGRMAMAGGIFHIPARSLVLSRPGDVVAIHADLLSQTAGILDHYRQLGLDCAQEFTSELSYRRLRRAGQLLDVFLFSRPANHAQRNRRRYRATRKFNNKNWFVQFCRQRGFPTPLYQCFRRRSPLPARRRRVDYPLYVKAAVSGAGMHVIRCANDTQLRTAIGNMPGAYQLQAEVPRVVASLNVLYFAHNGIAEHVLTTEQILDGVQHGGNRYPSRFDPRNVSDQLAQAAVDEGLEDFFAFDVTVDEAGELEFIECNPRINGSTYYGMMAYRLGVAGPWAGLNLPTRYRSLDDIHIPERLLYDRSRGWGVAIVGWGSVLFGKLSFILVGDEHQQDWLRSELTKVL